MVLLEKIMNVSLGQKWEHFVEDKVKSGDYQTASEVLRDGLRLLEKEALLKQISMNSLPELEIKLLKAAESLDAGRGVDGEGVFARLRQRSKSRRQNPYIHPRRIRRTRISCDWGLYCHRQPRRC